MTNNGVRFIYQVKSNERGPILTLILSVELRPFAMAAACWRLAGFARFRVAGIDQSRAVRAATLLPVQP